MTHPLSGKTALVTGAGSGIGRATAYAFAKAGANVVVADVDRGGGNETVSTITSGGGKALFVATDVSRPADVQALIAAARKHYGSLDCAFNNAGIQGELSSTADCTEENWDRITGINLKGVWLCMKYELEAMLAQGAGAIVNCASNFGLVGSVNMPAYSAAKHGVVAMSHTLNMEECANGIRSCVVCPGEVATPILDKRPIPPSLEERAKMLQPEDLGRIIRFVAETPAHVAIHEMLVVPTWNRSVMGGSDLKGKL